MRFLCLEFLQENLVGRNHKEPHASESHGKKHVNLVDYLSALDLSSSSFQNRIQNLKFAGLHSPPPVSCARILKYFILQRGFFQEHLSNGDI